MDNCVFDCVAFATVCMIFETCVCSWDDEKASEQYPGEKGSEYIVQPGYAVQMKEHAHVTCLDRGHARKELRSLM